MTWKEFKEQNIPVFKTMGIVAIVFGTIVGICCFIGHLLGNI